MLELDMTELRTAKLPELRKIAKQLNIKEAQHEKADSLRARITMLAFPDTINQINAALSQEDYDEKPNKRKAKQAVVKLTPDAVLEALGPLTRRIKVAFSNEDGEMTTGDDAVCWHIKNGPAEDSGNLTVDAKYGLKTIMQKAGEIANARFPATVKDPEFKGSLAL